MNYNLSKSEYIRQPQCPEEKEKAISGSVDRTAKTQKLQKLDKDNMYCVDILMVI